MMNSKLYYFHDPMCSWCWGFRPTWQELQLKLQDTNILIVYVLGGLAKDNNQPMSNELQTTIQNHWRNIHQLLGTKFNFNFWRENTPFRSTYLSCRAVISAKNQGVEKEMILAIQEAYYLRALNPSLEEVLVQLAYEVKQKHNLQDFNIELFQHDINSASTCQELDKQIKMYHRLSRRGFPSLTLAFEGEFYPVDVNYKESKVMLKQIQKCGAFK
ncbi:DsbA family protein [Aliikangiella sp. IMCC44359]|uniref:DsbA family protein n=1 Tax=Aliikangiella sp. IMCC44359 TaxID=3459125 RepID=UPI00403A859D